MPTSSHIRISAFLILALTFAAFYPCLHNDFTNLDDNEYVTENVIIREASRANIRHIFTSYFVGHYQPLSIFSYLIDYSLYKLNPFGYHLTNVILHMLNALLVMWLIYALTRNITAALITAVLFAVHPLRVESVAWVSERKDVLYAFFFLGSVIAYLYYLRDTRLLRYYFCSLSLFILSLLSKSMAVTLPLLLFAVDFFIGRKRTKNMVMDKAPFFMLSFIFSMVALVALDVTRGASSQTHLSLWHKIAGSSFSIMFYISKLCAPIKLSALYPHYPGSHPQLYMYSSAALFILIAGIIASRRYTKKIIFAAGLFLIPLLPLMQFVHNVSTATGGSVADRYVYVASIGIFYAAAEGYLWLYRRSKRAARVTLITALILIVAVLSVLTYRRCFVWRNSLSLWEDILGEGAETAFAYNSRGYAYYEQGNFEQALSEYNRALELDPQNADVRSNRGMIHYALGNFERALSDYHQAIQLNPRNPKAYVNRGVVYYRQGNLGQALSDYSKAIEIDPRFVDAYFNRGMAYYALGKFEEALSDYAQALAMYPGYAQVYVNRADIYRATGRLDQAIADYGRALEIDAENAHAYMSRGIAYAQREEFEPAFSDYSRAIAINPSFAEVYINRGNIHFRQGDHDRAIIDYNKAIALKPDNADFYGNRGILYHSIGNLDAALDDYTRSLTLNPDNPRMYSNRALLYFDRGEYNKSRDDVTRAQSLGWQTDPGFLERLKQQM